jgi:hypothetical protein
MIVTNVKISQKAQELLIKVAAEKRKSVEDLASEILNEPIENKFSGIDRIPEVKKRISPESIGK